MIKKCPSMLFNGILLIVLFSLLSLHYSLSSLHYSLLPLSHCLVLFILRLSWHITCEKNVTIPVYYESIVYYTMLSLFIILYECVLIILIIKGTTIENKF